MESHYAPLLLIVVADTVMVCDYIVAECENNLDLYSQTIRDWSFMASLLMKGVSQEITLIRSQENVWRVSMAEWGFGRWEGAKKMIVIREVAQPSYITEK